MKRLALIAILLMPLGAHSLSLEQPLANPTHEMRAQALFDAMRCMVCEGQPLATSDARHAADMRAVIRNMVEAGESDAAIEQFFHARYGDSVFMRPPANTSALPLWLAPFFILIGAVLVVWRRKKAAS